MIISKKRYNEAIAKAIEETNKQRYIENELRELRRMMFEDMERLRNDMRRLEGIVEAMVHENA